MRRRTDRKMRSLLMHLRRTTALITSILIVRHLQGRRPSSRILWRRARSPIVPNHRLLLLDVRPLLRRQSLLNP